MKATPTLDAHHLQEILDVVVAGVSTAKGIERALGAVSPTGTRANRLLKKLQEQGLVRIRHPQGTAFKKPLYKPRTACHHWEPTEDGLLLGRRL